jgi:hypothetical protein
VQILAQDVIPHFQHCWSRIIGSSDLLNLDVESFARKLHPFFRSLLPPSQQNDPIAGVPMRHHQHQTDDDATDSLGKKDELEEQGKQSSTVESDE